MKKIAIILAGGEGHRAGGEIPKQFQEVAGRPMYQWSLSAFHEEDASTEIFLVCHPGAFDLLDILEDERDLLPEDSPFRNSVPFRLICGGRTRWESVLNALMEIESSEDVFVAVHDSARPLVSKDMIKIGWTTAAEKGTAVPAVPVSDSLRQINSDGRSIHVDRSFYRAVQTPQVFRADILKSSYSKPENQAFTDDASIVQDAGHEIALFAGEKTNLKITYSSDFMIADAILSSN